MSSYILQSTQTGCGAYPVSCSVLIRVFSIGLLLSGRAAGQPLPFAAKVKNQWRYISTSPYAFMNASGADTAAADHMGQGAPKRT